LVGLLVGWLIGWLVGLLVGWFVGLLVGLFVGWLVGWFVGWLDGHSLRTFIPPVPPVMSSFRPGLNTIHNTECISADTEITSWRFRLKTLN